MGVGLFVWKQTNVIVRNIISQKVLAANGDGIGIQNSTNVWVDHWFVGAVTLLGSPTNVR